MLPIDLSSPLLRLDQLAPADAERMFRYCQDPLFERYLTVPWPYARSDADSFISGYVPGGWESDSEYTWALRGPDAPELLGVIGLRLPNRPIGSIGFWLGAMHRGQGFMPEAQRLVADWAFASGVVDSIHWECKLGNIASARAAWKSGFTFNGVAPSTAPFRDGSHPRSWQGRLCASDDRQPKAGWPAEVLAG